MCAYPWPGNIRELGHAVESAMLMADGDELGLWHLPVLGENGSDERERSLPIIPTVTIEAAAPIAEEATEFSLEIAIDAASKRMLLRALKAAGGDCQHTARLLGISRYTVYRMVARHHLGSLRDYHSWPQNRPAH